ncbi:hypothetical protein ACHQM5_000555 [Ranunculus cassubicifolius]
MEDAKDTEETPTRGNDWEVVSLTASAYAAAPGPDAFDSAVEEHGVESNKDDGNDDDDEASRAMFMSGHFVFPPNQHENLPLEPVDNEIHTESENEGVNAIGLDLEGDESQKVIQENWDVKGMEVPENLGAKGMNLSGHDTEFGSGKALEELNVVEEEPTIYTAHKFSSLLGEADISGSTVLEENIVIPEQNVAEEDSSSDSSKSLSPKENKSKGYGLPCEAWWKRQAASLYAQAKEANALWSVFVAAALMGLVILGQRWQQERWQTLQSNIGNEKTNRMMGPLSRFKDVLVGGHRQGSVLRGATSSER